MTEREAIAVVDMMETCDHSLHIWIETVDHLETGTGEHKETPEAESSNPVYGSCEEATEAGEEREQGSRGAGEQGLSTKLKPRWYLHSRGYDRRPGCPDEAVPPISRKRSASVSGFPP